MTLKKRIFFHVASNLMWFASIYGPYLLVTHVAMPLLGIPPAYTTFTEYQP